MSLFLSRMAKLSARRDTTHRFFSSLHPRAPYLLTTSPMISVIEAAKLKERKKISIEDKKLTLRFGNVGISHGWHAYVKEGLITITDHFKPWITSPRYITLPPLEFMPSDICLSSSDPVSDTLVAAMYNNDMFDKRDILSVCTLDSDKWIHIKDPFPKQPLLSADKLMYSKRDETFYFTCSKGFRLGSIDVTNGKLHSHVLCLRNMPEIRPYARRVRHKCLFTKHTKHLVESPSGELFYIVWYTKLIHLPDMGKTYQLKPRRFMVFKQDEKSKDFCYTEDIGDLSIFLADTGDIMFLDYYKKSEDFCVKASMYPGLKPNSIYYLGSVQATGFGCYDIASRKVHSYYSSTPSYHKLGWSKDDPWFDKSDAWFRHHSAYSWDDIAWISPN